MIEERKFRENVNKILEAAGEALSGSEIQETLDATDSVVGTLNNLFQLVKIQQMNYCDLGVRFGLARGTIKMLNQAIAVSSG